MEKVRYRLVFNRQKRLNSRGMALVQVEAYLKGYKKYFSTHVYLKPIQWNEKKKRIVRHPHANELNQLLGEMLVNLEKAEIDLWKKGKPITLEALKRAVAEQVKDGDFLAFILQEIKTSSLKVGTRMNHLSTYNVLKKFNKTISFNEVTYEFLKAFELFLHEQHYHVNTIAKHMKHLKRFLNIAIYKELVEKQHYAFRKYKIKTVENKHSFLTPDELDRLENLSLSEKDIKFQKTLDAFLFCCYAGLRYSDFTKLKEKNFFTLQGNTWLYYQSVKTGTNVRIPLNLLFEGKPLKLYNKYRENLPLFFSLKDNSNINKELDKIAHLAQLDKEISFHTARHTNASLLIYKGVNITTVQKLLGHKNVKTTQIYTHIMDSTIINDLEKCQNINTK